MDTRDVVENSIVPCARQLVGRLLLARSATGQELSVYTTFSTGKRREQDLDGPDAFHVVLDAGRSEVIGTSFQAMLRCIREKGYLCTKGGRAGSRARPAGSIELGKQATD